MLQTKTAGKFPLGNVIWPDLPDHLANRETDMDHISLRDFIQWYCLDCHASGDWGLVDSETVRTNEHALQHGGRLVSRHGLIAGDDNTFVEIITEADRSVTRMTISGDLSRL